MRWLEVSLATTSENAEAVADVLARFAPDGTAISAPAAPPHAPLTVRAYLPEGRADADQVQRIRQALWHLGRIAPLPEPDFTWIEAEDWSETWKQHFQPIVSGRRLVVVPAWMSHDDPERLPLFLDPGMAFGTGAHPSTRQCLAALESAVHPGDLVVDVGCGSGILSVAALLFGARRALACDLDPQAIEATRRCAERNGVADRLEVFAGSLSEVVARLGGASAADVLVANILAPVLVDLLAAGLADPLRQGGRLILAGILEDQLPGVESAARAAGLKPDQTFTELDWVGLVYRKESAAPALGAAP